MGSTCDTIRRHVVDGVSIDTNAQHTILCRIARNLSIEYINAGVPGSANQFIILQFLRYLKSSMYDKDDIFVIFSSSFERIYAYGMPPYIGPVQWLSDGGFVKRAGLSNDELAWVTHNIRHVQWAAANINESSVCISTLSFASIIQAWATSNPTHQVILYPGFSLNVEDSAPFVLDIIKPIGNFYPFYDYVPLYPMSAREFESVNSMIADFSKHGDSRTNHFNNANLDKIAKMFTEVIQNRDRSFFNTDVIT